MNFNRGRSRLAGPAHYPEREPEGFGIVKNRTMLFALQIHPGGVGVFSVKKPWGNIKGRMGAYKPYQNSINLCVSHIYASSLRHLSRHRSEPGNNTSVPNDQGYHVYGGKVRTARVLKGNFLYLHLCDWGPWSFKIHPPYACT